MSDDIVQLEWEFFQHVQHIDGRASCQDDFETFYLQRKSQFDAFDQDVQQACLQDLKIAKQIPPIGGELKECAILIEGKTNEFGFL